MPRQAEPELDCEPGFAHEIVAHRRIASHQLLFRSRFDRAFYPRADRIGGMRQKKPAWSKLKIGDRVRFVRLPTFQGVAGGGLLEETLDLYKRLIATKRTARVFQIDEYCLPWIRCRFRRNDGTWEHHWLAINDDSWELVRPRNPPSNT